MYLPTLHSTFFAILSPYFTWCILRNLIYLPTLHGTFFAILFISLLYMVHSWKSYLPTLHGTFLEVLSPYFTRGYSIPHILENIEDVFSQNPFFLCIIFILFF